MESPNQKNLKEKKNKQPVFLISRYGYPPFGGGEYFLIDMARCYAKEGYQPYIIGLEDGRTNSEIKEVEHFKHFRMGYWPDNILNILKGMNPKLIHILSGSYNMVAKAAHTLGIPVVYGIHFWRDIIDMRRGYKDLSIRKDFLKSFEDILINCDYLYANSKFSQEVVERGYGFKFPTIYSVPYEKEIKETPEDKRDVVLLVNTHPLKGFDVFLETAESCPDLRFVAIANQTNIYDAKETAEHYNKHGNIEILYPFKDLNELYSKVRVVYAQAIESFGRVVIEAQRRGIPCIGIDQGNVKYLLEESGVILQKMSQIVSKEIKDMQDPEYYHNLCVKAKENSKKYEFDQQYNKIKDVLSYIDKKILVCVGAGIGNILRTTPIIKRISEKYGVKVDVFLRSDVKSCVKLMENDKYVNMVITNQEVIANRRYDIVFITGSCGFEYPLFNADKLIEPQNSGFYFSNHCVQMHENDYNTASLKYLNDGINTNPPTIDEFYVGNYKYVPPKNKIPIIGIHSAKGKNQMWKKKEYPYFQRIVNTINGEYEIWSFGLPPEYVSGVVNKTGIPIHETVEEMMKCDFFLSTDSGLLQIADFLGIPCIGLFGPTSIVKNSPINKTSKIIQSKEPCVPCQYREEQTTCKDYKCMKSIDYLEVIKTMEEMIYENRK